ncbi:MAG: fimbrillin family protein [Bacteroides intestinalis]
MKKKHSIWIASAALVLSLSACQDNESPAGTTAREEVTLSFSVDATPHSPSVYRGGVGNTRAATPDKKLPAGAQVGIYFAAAGATSLSGLDVNSDNHPYAADGTTSDPVYWNDYLTALDLYAYSPRQDSPTTNSTNNGLTAATGLSWTVQTDQKTTDKVTASDLLVSNNVRDLTYTKNMGGEGNLTFTHALAKLRINIVDNAGTGNDYTPAELAAATVSITGLHTKCDVIFVGKDASDGKDGKDITNLSEVAPITPKTLDAPASGPENNLGGLTAIATYEAICIPQTVESDAAIATITITHDKTAQSYTLKATDATYALQQGATNILNVSISKASVSLGFAVTDWDTGSTASKTITIDGFTDAGKPGVSGDGSFTPSVGDALRLTYVTTGGGSGDALSTAPKQTATYTCNNASSPATWTSAAPLYWDDIAQDGYSGKFAALYTYQTKTTPEVDFLTGLAVTREATGVEGNAYGTPLSVTLAHAMSQISVTLVPGEGYESADAMLAALTTRIIRLKGTTAGYTPTVDAAGNPAITLADAVSDLIGGTATATTPSASGIPAGGKATNGAPFKNGTVYTVAPQELTANTGNPDADAAIVLKLTNGNSYTLKLADIEKSAAAPSSRASGVTGEKLFAGGKIEPGKKYAITITVDETAVSLSGSIEAWMTLEGSGSMKPDW